MTEDEVRVTEDLQREHRDIVLMLRIMQAVSRKIRRGVKVSRDDLNAVLEFMDVFVDACHQGKEEKILYPAIESTGVRFRCPGKVAALAQHEACRSIVQFLRSTLQACDEDYSDAATVIASTIRQYVETMRRHIQTEEENLFPIADGAIDQLEQDRIVRSFGEFDQGLADSGKRRQFDEMLLRLSVSHLPKSDPPVF